MAERERAAAKTLPDAEPSANGATPHDQSFEVFLDLLPSGFAALAADGRFTWVNRRACELWRVPGAQLVGRRVENLFGGTRLAAELSKALATETESVFELFDAPTDRWFGYRTNAAAGGVSVYFEEITQRKRAEEAAARLGAIVGSTDDAIISKDLDGIITTWNKSAEQLFGYTAEEVFGRSITLIIPSERLEEETYILSRLRLGERVDHFETVRRRKDGSPVEVSLTISPVKDVAGEVVGASKIVRDITRQKQAAAATGLLGAIVDSSDDSIISKKLDGTITSWNKSAERLFGYAAEEIVGKSITLLIPRGREHEEPEIIAKLKRGERVEHLETFRLRKDGTQIELSLTISPMKDDRGRIIGASQIAHDITDRRRSEKSTILLGAIVDSSEDAIVSKTLDGTITSWNKSAERLFGYTEEEAVGQSIRLIIPAERSGEETEIISRISRGERVEHFETKRRRKDGTLVDLSLTISPVRDPSGRIVGASKIARDITERKRTDDELRRANKDLEQFAFSASHDLQEPLRTIKIYSELLATRHPDIVAGESAEFLGYLRQAATRMEALVRDLLAYAQVTRLDDPAEPHDVSAALLETMSLLSGSLLQSGGLITHDALPSVRVHATHLRLLLQNLIGNAIKYRCPDRELLVHVSAERQPRCWVFAVRDNGIGIKPQYKEQIFDLFTRLHTGEEYAGTGIGLAICKRIVERYRGRIWVESEPGKGSTFSFEFPD